MTLFGKKDKDGAGDEFEGISEIEATGGLSAPRSGLPPAAGSGRGKGPFLLLLLTVAAGAGGYFFMQPSGQPDTYATAPLPQAAAAPEATAVENAALPSPEMAAAITEVAADIASATPVAEMPGMPPQPAGPADLASSDPLAAAMTTPPVDAAAAPEGASPQVPPTETVGAAAEPVASPADAVTPPPVAAEGADPALALLPPPETETAVPAEELLTPDIPPATPLETPALPAPAETLAVPADEAQTALDPPPEDLPLPAETMMAVPSTAPGTDPGSAEKTPPETASAPETVVETAPTAAEKAIVENAAVLDQLSQPAETVPGVAAPVTAADTMKTADEILGQEAIVRPLPKQYLVVKKDHAAGDIDSRLTAARLALGQNRVQPALELFNQLYKDYPKDNRILMGRAVALQKLGQYEEALAAYEDVLNADPKNLEALTNMLGLIKQQNPGLAVEKLLELREAYPYNADITAQLGIAYAGSKEYTEALKYLDMAEALNPGSSEILYNKAVLYDRMGRAQEAGELYRQIVRMSAEGRIDRALPIEAVKRRLATLR